MARKEREVSLALRIHTNVIVPQFMLIVLLFAQTGRNSSNIQDLDYLVRIFANNAQALPFEQLLYLEQLYNPGDETKLMFILFVLSTDTWSSRPTFDTKYQIYNTQLLKFMHNLNENICVIF